ncbi:MAG: hypothetical protein VX527_04125 [Planctomycetota bacterium]|nr:hypothetical protein [Planctomycetota bacterium]
MLTQIIYRNGAANLAVCFISLSCSTLLASSDAAVNEGRGGSEEYVLIDHVQVPPRSSGEDGANEAPGYGTGAHHTAFIYAPMAFLYTENGGTREDSGEAYYRKHVASVEGQQYGLVEIMQTNTTSQVCTVESFYDLIRNNRERFGTLLITASGGEGWIGVEPYMNTPVGLQKRDERYFELVGTEFDGIELTDEHITQETDEEGYHFVAVTPLFVAQFGDMPGSLVYIASDFGSSMNFSFLEARARVAVGYVDDSLPIQRRKLVKKTFMQMDGLKGIEKRPIGQAIKGTNKLILAGNGATTLAPAVKEPVVLPCPLAVGDKVIFTFDTHCDTNFIPQVISNEANFNATWISSTQLQANCTAVTNRLNYQVTLRWETLKARMNDSQLDGNTKPAQKNAHGPAHDDYKKRKRCQDPCATDVNDDLVTDVADMLLVIAGWGDSGADSSADSNQDGMIDIQDLLAVIGGWDDQCVYGSCCLDGACFPETTLEQCDEMGGLYLGDWETCDSGFCLWGGCCIEGVECLDAYSPADCVDMGGTYAGDGTPCDVVACEVPVSACCLQDGSCINFATEDECTDVDGNFVGFGIPCSDWECTPWETYGACCILDPIDGTMMCIETTDGSDCTDGWGGTFHIGEICVDFVCDMTGACCIQGADFTYCEEVPSAETCQAQGGVFHLGGSCDEIECEF